MRLFFINNDGGGFADTIEVSDGTSITQLFEQRMPHGKPEQCCERGASVRFLRSFAKAESRALRLDWLAAL